MPSNARYVKQNKILPRYTRQDDSNNIRPTNYLCDNGFFPLLCVDKPRYACQDNMCRSLPRAKSKKPEFDIRI